MTQHCSVTKIDREGGRTVFPSYLSCGVSIVMINAVLGALCIIMTNRLAMQRWLLNKERDYLMRVKIKYFDSPRDWKLNNCLKL